MQLRSEDASHWRREVTSKAAAERFQRVLRVALEKMDTLRLPELNESYYDAFRDAMLVAGAVDGDIDVLAAFHVTSIELNRATLRGTPGAVAGGLNGGHYGQRLGRGSRRRRRRLYVDHHAHSHVA